MVRELFGNSDVGRHLFRPVSLMHSTANTGQNHSGETPTAIRFKVRHRRQNAKEINGAISGG
jgi:hypothetical protein